MAGAVLCSRLSLLRMQLSCAPIASSTSVAYCCSSASRRWLWPQCEAAMPALHCSQRPCLRWKSCTSRRDPCRSLDCRVPKCPGKLVRSGEWRYQCDTCQRSYSRFVTLGRAPPRIGIRHRSTDKQAGSSESSTSTEPPGKEESPATAPSPKEIMHYLNAHVIGQEKAKKVLAVAGFNHWLRTHWRDSSSETKDAPRDVFPAAVSILKSDSRHFQGKGERPAKVVAMTISAHYPQASDSQQQPASHAAEDPEPEVGKSNIILLGPTGTGKTHMVKALAKFLNVPTVTVDCTSLTEAGYVGDDVETVLARLLQVSEYDTKRAEKGIVFLDEGDKLAGRQGMMSHNGRDISGVGVQQGLLKMVEGTKVNVPLKGSGRVSNVIVDTTNILFVLLGAFSGLDEIISNRKDQKPVGFNFGKNERSEERLPLSPPVSRGESTAETRTDDDKHKRRLEKVKQRDDLLAQAEGSDLIKYGFIPEFVGRFPVVVPFHSLNEGSLMRILTEPRNALVAQFQYLFSLDNVKLEFTEDAIRAIARKAMQKDIGARGLRQVVEHALLDVQFEIPGTDVCRVLMTEDAIDGKSPPLLERRSVEENVQHEEESEPRIRAEGI